MDTLEPPCEDTKKVVSGVIAGNLQFSEVASEDPKVSSDENSQLRELTTAHSQVRKKYKRERGFCGVCNKIFFEKAYLKIHLRTHTKERPYKCTICSKRFRTIGSHKYHLLTHSKEKHHVCELCNKSFRHKRTLTLHVRVHSQQTFNCNLCERKFYHISNLSRHLRRHQASEKLAPSPPVPKCEFCGRVFSSQRILKTHYMLHTGERPYVCEFCNKGFITKMRLTNHRFSCHRQDLNIEEENLFPCQLCDKMFLGKEGLRKHSLMHAGEKPYPCNICNERFLQKKTLRKHHRLLHTEQIPDFGKNKHFVCEMCNRLFDDKPNFEIHIKFCTKRKPYKCGECSRSFEESSRLQKHQLVHLKKMSFFFKCESCGVHFKKQYELEKHLGTHIPVYESLDKAGDKSDLLPNLQAAQLSCVSQQKSIVLKKELFSCELCDKMFKYEHKLKKHRRIHTRPKEYVCELCNKTYKNGGCFQRHQLTYHARKQKINIFEREFCNK